ncbi:MAG TPA: stage II sporulation protein P [Limnochordia bacterium]
MIDVSVTRLPEKNGPGLLFVLVLLVVAAVVGAKLFGLGPGGRWSLHRSGQAPGELSGGADRPAPRASGPEVIVYHTHARENFSPKVAHEPRGEGDIVRVGAVLARELEALGFGVQHIKEIHDLPRWSEAFDRARRSLTDALAKAPGVVAVIDLHRDAIEQPGSEPAATPAAPPGAAAPILLVVGDTENPEAAANLAFAQRLRNALDEVQPGIARGVRLYHRAMNGDLHPNSLQVYIGDYDENTVAEAEAAAVILARALARVLAEPEEAGQDR